ncbi:MAG: DUF362 domain-containing protein [Anaerolineaceae bacterium]|nr:DUF362 domain-containing protein [Anaerolineaceae bacterium]
MKPLNVSDLSRRRFLQSAGGGVLALLAAGYGRLRAQGVPGRSSRVYLGRFDPAVTTAETAVRDALLASTDLSWLHAGDSVFIKVASNSNLGPPAVTSPAVLTGVIKTLQEAGAGTVYVGDMSGALFVRHLATETIGSTRDNMRENGLLAAAEDAGAVIHCFEEVPFEQAYIPGIPAGEHHWGTDLTVAAILDEVDHIINLPRLGKHVLAGASLGLKNAVGWISDYSRMALHRDGDLFQQRIAEINAIPQIAEKQRLTLTLVDRALTTYGPDSGYALALDQPLVIASEDVVSHDQVALLTLLWGRQQTPLDALKSDPYPDESDGLNWWFVRVTWGSDAAAAYQPLSTFTDITGVDVPTHINYAYDILYGGRPDQIIVTPGGLPWPDNLAITLTSEPALGIRVGEPVA